MYHQPAIKKIFSQLSIISLILLGLSSCRTTIPLVVNSPMPPNSNVVTSKGQLAGQVAYVTNAGGKVTGETLSSALQADAKYSVTKNIFVEGALFTQKENDTKEVIETTSVGGVQTIDTFLSNKKYNNTAFSIGAGYNLLLDKGIGKYSFSISAGYSSHKYDVKMADRDNGITTTDAVNFTNNSFYLNPSLHIHTATFGYTLGLQQSFATYRINSGANSSAFYDVDSLRSLTSNTRSNLQLYQTISAAPFSVPVAFKVYFGINIMSTPSFLNSRTIGFGLGLAYAPAQKKNK